MKATLEFDLPDETEEHLCAVNSGALRAAIESVDNWLRSQQKYHDKTEVSIDEMRSKLREETSTVSWIWS